MISVLPLKDKEKLKVLYTEYGLSYGENAFCVLAKEKEQEMGFCLFDLSKDCAVVHTLVPSDNLSLADGILRSAIHVAVTSGTVKVYYSEKADEDLLDKLKFIADKGEKKLDAAKLFKKCSSCGN